MDNSIGDKAISGLSYPPTFDDGSTANIQTLEVDLGFADNVIVKWGLDG